MSLYSPGLDKAIESVYAMSDAQLYDHLDSLYGRDNLRSNPTRADLEREAVEQTKRDFRNAEAREEWERVETHAKIALALSRKPYR